MIVGPRRLATSENVLGCIYVVLASLGYTANDAFIRVATDRGADVYQTLFVRGVVVSAAFVVACRVAGQRVDRALFSKAVVVRLISEMAAAALFFAGLVRLDFANAQTILMVVPFAITIVAAASLGERVSRGRYLAVLLGFGGVLIVVRPATDRFSGWSLVVIASAAFLVVRDFATRQVSASTPALVIATVTAIAVAVLVGVVSIFTGWKPMSGRWAFATAAACACLMVGYVFAIKSVRVGDLSVSASFRYSTVVGAVVIGRVFFHERLDRLAGAGCVLIVAAGVIAALLERRERPRSEHGARTSG